MGAAAPFVARRTPFAALLVPELRWDPDHRFAHLAALIEESLELGVGGFVVAGGPAEDVAALTASLGRDAREPLLLAAPLEAGAGGTFPGATALPPFGALGVLRDHAAIQRAATLTAREARALGITWALAPVADVAPDGRHPALRARALAVPAQRAAEYVVDWIEACQREGVMACAMHYPGLGRALGDPAEGPVAIDAGAGTLWAEDLLPFRAAVDAGVASILASGAVYPRLDPTQVPAHASRPLLRELLRGELGFDGLIVGAAPPHEDGGAAHAVAALAAGADLVLAPGDPHAAHEAILAALDAGTLGVDALERSHARRAFWADWGRVAPGREATLDDVLWGRQVADVVVHPVRGRLPVLGRVVDLALVADEEAPGAPRAVGPRGEPRRGVVLAQTLRSLEREARYVPGPTAEGTGVLVIAAFLADAPPRTPGAGVGGGAGSGMGARARRLESARRRVAALVAEARTAGRAAVLCLFAPPAWAEWFPEAEHVLCCWGAGVAMEAAAARRLAAAGPPG